MVVTVHLDRSNMIHCRGILSGRQISRWSIEERCEYMEVVEQESEIDGRQQEN